MKISFESKGDFNGVQSYLKKITSFYNFYGVMEYFLWICNADVQTNIWPYVENFVTPVSKNMWQHLVKWLVK